MAHLSRPELWAKIEAYEFPDLQNGTRFDDHVKNSIKVSSKTVGLAIAEYRRFIYLRMIAPGEVVPSKMLDEIWCSHATLTEGYLERFCTDVLRRKLHYAFRADEAFEAASYATTLRKHREALNLYKSEFGCAAPELFWPQPQRKRSYSVAGLLVFAVVMVAASYGFAHRPGKFIPVLAIIFLFLFAVSFPKTARAFGIQWKSGDFSEEGD